MKKISFEALGGTFWIALLVAFATYFSINAPLGADYRPSNAFEEFIISLLPDHTIASGDEERDAPKTPVKPPQVAILPDRTWLAGSRPSEFRDDRRRASNDPHARRFAAGAKSPPRRPSTRA